MQTNTGASPLECATDIGIPISPDSAPFLNFSASPDFYRLGKVSNLDIFDQLSMQIDRLQGMMKMTCGEQGTAFRTMNDTLQDNYMWACAGLVDECKELLDHMGRSGGVAL